MDNKFVYVVMRDSSDEDIRIEGVFEDEKTATQVRNASGDYIVKVELNRKDPHVAAGETLYEVQIGKFDGKTTPCTAHITHETDENDYYSKRANETGFAGWHFFVWATDRDHAISIAYDRELKLNQSIKVKQNG